MLTRVCCLFAFLSCFLVKCQNTSSSELFDPAIVPLAVRSPYLSAWQNLSPPAAFGAGWPQFGNTFEPYSVLGWVGYIRVDGLTYSWLGGDVLDQHVNVTAVHITPTRTIYAIVAGPMDATVTFLSPIEPSDWVQQSIPFSYVSINASSNDGNSHAVQVYSDVTAEWLSSNRSAKVQWNTTLTDEIVYHQIQLETPSPFTENYGQAEDGILYYSMPYSSAVTFQTGGSTSLRTNFAQNGELTGSVAQDPGSGALNADTFPAYAISVNLGSITTTESPIMWAVGYVRNPSISYTTFTGRQLRSPYYVTQYSSTQEVIQAFLSDFSNALTRSQTLDSQVTQAASSISSKYSDLISLAARQSFGGIDITVSRGSDGNWNTSDTMIFMKNMGYSISRVNPVENMYAAFPMFLYFNASFGKALLAPLLEYQDSPAFTFPFAISDLGSSYPIAGFSDAESAMADSTGIEGVEQSGNMLIMSLAHARFSGDGSLIGQHYNLLRNWTDYLVQNSMSMANQQSADGQTSANMTNLAIKGIIGIKAMAEISAACSQVDDAKYFADIAADYVNTWLSLALSSNQKNFLFSYDDANSWALMYNLYADLLLGTKLINQSIYEAQTEYYQALIDGGSGGPFGLPIDSTTSESQGNSAWALFTAASVSNPTTRESFISSVWEHTLVNKTTPSFFATVYNVETGAILNGSANPAQGAMFAPLALSLSNKTIKVPSTIHVITQPDFATSSTAHVAVGAIVGGVVGGVVGLGLILVAVLRFWRRSRRIPSATPVGRSDMSSTNETGAVSYEATPFLSPLDNRPESQNAQPFVIMSSKLRERLFGQEPPHPASASSTTTNPTPPSRSELPSVAGSDDTSVFSDDLLNLRTEVQQLRRVMQELQTERFEAPPDYATQVS